MKKIIIILIILSTLILTGVLSGKLVQPDTVGTIDTMGAKEVDMDQFPDFTPYLTIDPMVCFSLY